MQELADDTTPSRGLRRREALGLFGGLGVTGLIGAVGLRGSADAATSGTTASCVLTPEVTEGPYWIDTELTRRDITEDRPGLPLEVIIRVQNAKTCEPIPGADVEIWHCDAGGLYSGFEAASPGTGGPGEGGPGGPPPTGEPPTGGGGDAGGMQRQPTSETRYLRGHQVAGAAGQARFATIFPGWYAGRVPHIHLKVHVGGDVVHTGQVFFSERVTASVYTREPYSAHGEPDTTHAEDGIYAAAGASRAQLRLERRRDRGRSEGYRGRITLGVAA